ncbi:ubiquitin-conjugating enzyme E2Q-like protein 1 [Entelurus aequoreus]|uniref:ubiquitin-conjugating enzyme E2Q-like protein 1 n=1 Tax=Entelurus aequoreus TaxID=161455 RepID=UPI002B1D4160|nr:ubiquitin-conjugating enzyme E2Q-like protein 1 [Entelurus aequoreus]XP_061886150.1 ubiquitin-conjugating enzyme E2Q-like protein 1 [Entelurus aequoreus]
MATLLRKIGLIRLHDRDTEDPKHHQGSLKGSKGSQKSNKLCQTANESNILSTPEIKARKLDQNAKDRDKEKEKEKASKDASKERQQPQQTGGGGNKSTGASSVPAAAPAPHRQHCSQVRTRRLMKELQEIRRLGDNFITVELVEDNLYDWNVKLHQVDKDSALWQDMKETSTDFILLNVTFPDNFPFSPPFMRVLTPRLENGYVLDGGAICMELLTPRGWSSAYTVEAVMRQFAASLVKGQGRICRKAGKSKKAFSRKEAEATFKSLVKTHEKYGWVSPPVSDG